MDRLLRVGSARRLNESVYLPTARKHGRRKAKSEVDRDKEFEFVRGSRPEVVRERRAGDR